MLRLIILTSLLLCVSSVPVIAQTKPGATTSPVVPVEQLFADDTLKFAVPAGWRVTKVSEDTRWVELTEITGGGLMVVNTTPQTGSLGQNPDAKQKIGELIVKNLRELLERGKLTMVDPPRMKRDEAFFLRIEDRYRTEDAKTATRLHVYRVYGIHLLMVAATSFDESAEYQAQTYVAGEKLVYAIKANKIVRPTGIPTQGKPSPFRKAKVRLTPAKGWVEEKSDKDDGIIATYREPVGSGIVIVRVLSMAIQKDPRDAVVARLSADDLASLAPPDAKPEPVQDIASGPFAKKAQQKHDRLGPTLRVENRVMIVGEMLLSVTSASNELKAEPVSKFADDLATTAEVFTPR